MRTGQPQYGSTRHNQPFPMSRQKMGSPAQRQRPWCMHPAGALAIGMVAMQMYVQCEGVFQSTKHASANGPQPHLAHNATQITHPVKAFLYNPPDRRQNCRNNTRDKQHLSYRETIAILDLDPDQPS
ncbi:hypothetical protein SUNI508_11086 [Seiridium unicorne]|uniref:Uncharacterized protein n=1 Tax=Seiridium unicorne TaxID=138068 RepID=A0ABR2UJ60_9PEZI